MNGSRDHIEKANERESTTEQMAESLVASLRRHTSIVVAFSGGVDSAVVAAAAHRALGAKAVAWTSLGAAVPQSDRQAARKVAADIGIAHVECVTDEISNPDYARNGPDRCFHCKSTLYAAIQRWAEEHAFETIVSGTNADDLGDYRPGLRAADAFHVVAPLAELGIGKSDVRRIATAWGLSIADKPASPCLSSRIAYGQVVTFGKLTSIERMETWLLERGFRDVRARVHGDGLLRLELPADQLAEALQSSLREEIVALARGLGFHFVTLDLAGRESGSLNRTILRP